MHNDVDVDIFSLFIVSCDPRKCEQRPWEGPVLRTAALLRPASTRSWNFWSISTKSDNTAAAVSSNYNNGQCSLRKVSNKLNILILFIGGPAIICSRMQILFQNILSSFGPDQRHSSLESIFKIKWLECVLCTAVTDTDKLEHTRGRGEGPRWVRDKSPGPETRIQECLECSLMSPELRPFHFGLLGQVLGSLIS